MTIEDNAATLTPPDAVICDLPEEQLQARLAMIRREILPHATSASEDAEGRRWTFPVDDEIRARLENLIELERRCCAGLRIDLLETPQQLELCVRGTELRTQGMATLAEPPSPHEPGRLVKLLKAGGAGAAGSFFVFCVLPIAAAAVLGAGVTLPFAENPVALGLGSLALAVPAWWWFERRRAGKAADAGDCGC